MSTMSKKIGWLKNNLPIFYQPKIDVKNGNNLEGVFVNFTEKRVEINILYRGESSYNRQNKNSLNTLGTFLYRTHNFRLFKRTADINQLFYENVNFDDNSWDGINTKDYDGGQIWSSGSFNFLLFYSFYRHYDAFFPFKTLTFNDARRPIIYVNTCNHLHGPTNMNVDMDFVVYKNYPVWEGDALTAQNYAMFKCPIKFNLFSFIKCCLSTKNKYEFSQINVF